MKNTMSTLFTTVLISLGFSSQSYSSSTHFFAVDSSAEDLSYHKIQCPSIHPQISQLINTFDQLRDKIRNEARNCSTEKEQTNVNSTLNGVHSFLSSNQRINFFDLFDKNKNKALTAQQTAFIQKYAYSATQVFFKFMGAIKNSSCFEREKTKSQALSNAASIITEITRLAAMVSGPYGAPITLFGSLTSGVLTGLKTYVSAANPGYDFKEKSQRDAYANTLCSYYEIRQQLVNSTHPMKRVSELTKLQETLLSRLQDLSKNCTNCEQIIKSYLFPTSKKINFSSEKWSVLASEADKKFLKPLGEITLETINSLEWVLAEKKNLEDIHNDQFSSVGPAELLKLKISLDRFLFKSQAQRYLNWSINNTKKTYDRYLSFTKWWVDTFSLKFYPVASKSESDLFPKLTPFLERVAKREVNHEFAHRFFIESGLDWSDSHLKIHYQDSQDQFQLFYFNLNAVIEYCDFFNSMELSSQVKLLCSSETLSKLITRKKSILNDISKGSSEEGSAILMTERSFTNTVNSPTTWLDGLKKLNQKWASDKTLFQTK